MSKAEKDYSTTRRMMMADGASLAAADVAARAVAAPAVSPDAELTRLCDTYVRGLYSFNREKREYPGLTSAEATARELELYKPLSVMERQLDELSAMTMEGVAAQARVATAIATQPDGTVDFDYDGLEWAERVVRSVLRVHGEKV